MIYKKGLWLGANEPSHREERDLRKRKIILHRISDKEILLSIYKYLLVKNGITGKETSLQKYVWLNSFYYDVIILEVFRLITYRYLTNLEMKGGYILERRQRTFKKVRHIR